MTIQLDGERFKAPIDLQPFVPSGKSDITALTATELEAFQARIQGMLDQLTEANQVLADEQARRERDNLVACCEDWEKCLKGANIDPPSRTKKGKRLNRWRNRVAECVACFAKHMSTRQRLAISGVELGSAKTLEGIFSAPMPLLREMEMTEVTCPGEVSRWPVACFPSTLRQLTLMGVSARVELAALVPLTELRICVIDGTVTGNIGDIGVKKHLVRLSIHAHITVVGRPKNQVKTLGTLSQIPDLPAVQHLELRACGLTGKIETLNKFGTVAMLNLDENPVHGNLLRVKINETLTSLAIRNTRVQAKQGGVMNWALEHPKLQSIQTEGCLANVGAVFFQTKGK